MTTPLASLLPNGQQQFANIDGPLAGGFVFFYVPGTTTPKSTWQDSQQTVLNQNPVPLNANGQAVIYGTGDYRQVVRDSIGNTIWDQLTTSTLQNAGQTPYGVDTGGVNAINVASLSPEITSLATGQLVTVKINHTVTGATTFTLESFGTFAALTPNGLPFSANDCLISVDSVFVYNGTAMQLLSPNLGRWVFNTGLTSAGASASAYGTTGPTIACKRIATPATPNLATVIAQGTCTSTGVVQAELMANFGLISGAIAGVNQNSAHEAVTTFTGMNMQPGTGNCYALESILTLDAGATLANTAFGFAHQILVNNGDRDLPISLASGGATGLSISGAPSTGCTSTFGILVVGGSSGTKLFHVGFILEPNTCADYGIVEHSGATFGMALYGGASQVYQLDCAPGSVASATHASIRLPNASGITARNVADNADYPLLSLDASNSLLLGSVAITNIVPYASFAPGVNDSYNLGALGDQWHNIVGTHLVASTDVTSPVYITSSDFRLKADIQAMPTASVMVADLEPKLFRWREESPTHPLTSGFIAQDVKVWAKRHGLAAHTISPDGTEGYKADHLIAILWKAQQETQAELGAVKAALTTMRGGLA